MNSEDEITLREICQQWDNYTARQRKQVAWAVWKAKHRRLIGASHAATTIFCLVLFLGSFDPRRGLFYLILAFLAGWYVGIVHYFTARTPTAAKF